MWHSCTSAPWCPAWQNKLRKATVPPLDWQGNNTNNRLSFLCAHEIKWAGNLSGVEFRSKVAEDAWGDLWAFLDSCEEVGCVAGSAERSDFWLTRRRGGLRGNRAIPEVRGECWRGGNWFQLKIPVASMYSDYVNRSSMLLHCFWSLLTCCCIGQVRVQHCRRCAEL